MKEPDYSGRCKAFYIYFFQRFETFFFMLKAQIVKKYKFIWIKRKEMSACGLK